MRCKSVSETEVFRRRDLMDSGVGQAGKDDPAKVAYFDAMMNAEGYLVSGWKNEMQSALADIAPSSFLAGQHRKLAEPGSADRRRLVC